MKKVIFVAKIKKAKGRWTVQTQDRPVIIVRDKKEAREVVKAALQNFEGKT